MTDLSYLEMADMASLISQEEERLFGETVRRIKSYVKEHNEGLLTHTELIRSINLTINETRSV